MIGKVDVRGYYERLAADYRDRTGNDFMADVCERLARQAGADADYLNQKSIEPA